MSKHFWIALLIIATLLGGILAVSNHGRQTKATTSTGTPTQHIQGKGTADVTLLEYGDYECPVCATYYVTVGKVVAAYGDKITYQFRNLPLTEIHQNTFAASRAAEAAGLQNKYQQMHDLLYQTQQSWATSSTPQKFFGNLANQLGLNVKQFNEDYASEKVNDAINADIATFSKTGDSKATPTFYLNGKKLDNNKLIDKNGRPSVEAFSKLIDEEIANKTRK